DGTVNLPNNAEGGKALARMNWAEWGTAGSYNGQLDVGELQRRGFVSQAFMDGYHAERRTIASGQAVAAAQIMASAGVSLGGQALRPQSTTIVRSDGATLTGTPNPRTGGIAGEVRYPNGTVARQNTPGLDYTGTVTVGGSAQGGALTARTGGGGVTGPVATGANGPRGGGSPVGGGLVSTPSAAPAPSGASGGGSVGAMRRPQQPAGEDPAIAAQRARAAEQARIQEIMLDAASRNTPPASATGDVTLTPQGGASLDQVREMAWDWNRENGRGGNPATQAVTVVVPEYRRDYGGGTTRNEPMALTGHPADLAREVAAQQKAGTIPAGFDLDGAARQAGIADWGPRMQARANLVAAQQEAAAPTTLFGSQVGVFADRGEAIRFAVTQNRGTRGADPVAVAVPLTREIVDEAAGTSQTGVVQTVYVGTPDQAKAFLDAMRAQGRLAGNRSDESILYDAGINFSWGDRLAAAQTARAEAARAQADASFAQNMPVIGGQRTQPLFSNADYEAARDVTAQNNLNAADWTGTGLPDAVDITIPA
ncbi:hypothetical protein NJQ99_16220, partial [Hyphomicrobiales bacterium FT118]|nr:hypothetical protein [Futiania mangrovii]